jgi:hypothetical protein
VRANSGKLRGPRSDTRHRARLASGSPTSALILDDYSWISARYCTIDAEISHLHWYKAFYFKFKSRYTNLSEIPVCNYSLRCRPAGQRCYVHAPVHVECLEASERRGVPRAAAFPPSPSAKMPRRRSFLVRAAAWRPCGGDGGLAVYGQVPADVFSLL